MKVPVPMKLFAERAQSSPFFWRAGVSFIDQALLSLFNFSLGILLIKNIDQLSYFVNYLLTL